MLPFPYAIYRGDVLRIDQDEGVRGKLFERENINLDLSLAGSIPVPDTDDGARTGMDSLDPLVEAGAQLKIGLWNSKARGIDKKIEFAIPYRAVFSVGNPILEFQGWTLSPYVEYQLTQSKSDALRRYSISFGPILADSGYHNYFYEVAPRFVTPERPSYHASSGYSGSRVTASIAQNTKKYLVGAFARYDNLDGAEFSDSPLVETTDYFVFGFVFAWVFGSSETKVPH